MRDHLKWLYLLVCVIGFFMSGMIFNTIIRYSVASIFFVGFIIIFVFDGMRATQAFETNAINENQREGVIRDICDSGQVVKVTCPSGVGLGMFLMVFSALIFFTFNPDMWAKSFGTVMFLLSIHCVLVSIARIGRPALVLNRTGFETPEFGLIPWEEVERINLTAKNIEGTGIFQFYFHIPNLYRYRRQFWSYQAFLFQFRSKTSKKIAIVVLRDANERPAVIHNIAETLMKRAH